MADNKISELPAITGANLADADEFVVVDSSSAQTNRITRAELANGGFTSLNVTGTITSDGLTVDGVGVINTGSTTAYSAGMFTGTSIFTPQSYDGLAVQANTDGFASLYMESAGLTGYLGERAARITVSPTPLSSYGTDIIFNNRRNNAAMSQALKIDGNGDISFYEDTGTTPKFFWDASAESLGINNTAPDGDLTIGNISTSGDVSIRIKGDGTGRGFLMFGDPGGVQLGDIMYDHTVNSMRFRVNNNTAVTIDSNRNVGIGDPNPSEKLNVAGNIMLEVTDGIAYLCNVGTGNSGIYVRGRSGAGELRSHSTSIHTWEIAGNEAMRLDGSGLGIGMSGASPSYTLDTYGAVASRGSGLGNAAFVLQEQGNNPWHLMQFTGGAFSINYNGTSSGASVLAIDSSGNVGINELEPTARVHITESANLTESDAHIRIEGSGYSGFHFLNGTAYYIGQNSASRQVRIYSGAETAGVALVSGSTSWGTFSDERLKYDIENIDSAVETLSGIRTVKYRLKNVDAADAKKKIGIIAQDLEGVLDEVVETTMLENDDTEYKSVRYTELIPVLIKAIQEQQATIETLEARITQLETN